MSGQGIFSPGCAVCPQWKIILEPALTLGYGTLGLHSYRLHPDVAVSFVFPPIFVPFSSIAILPFDSTYGVEYKELIFQGLINISNTWNPVSISNHLLFISFAAETIVQCNTVSATRSSGSCWGDKMHTSKSVWEGIKWESRTLEGN